MNRASTSILWNHLRHFSDRCNSRMCEHFSYKAPILYRLATSCKICTGNFCEGTKPAGNAYLSTHFRDKIASGALLNSLLDSTASSLPTKRDEKFRTRRAETFTSDFSDFTNRIESFSHPDEKTMLLLVRNRSSQYLAYPHRCPKPVYRLF